MKRKPGRPKLEDRKQAKAETLTIRLTHDEKLTYENLAEAAGKPLGAWVRWALQTAAQHGIKKNGAPGN